MQEVYLAIKDVVGRKRIKISYIKDKRLRQTTFAKRKMGLLKKAMELSLLCGNEVLLVIRETTSRRATIYDSQGGYTQFIAGLVDQSLACNYSNDNVTHCIISSTKNCLTTHY